MYTPRRPARSRFVPLRSHRYHVLCWGPEPSPGIPALVLLHGWMDVGASWQFVVDALADDRAVFAPDWRGFGQTTGPTVDHYQFADYLADLDVLLDALVANTPVDLVGHSMGGNVAMLYAGVRPARVRRLVNLEGFGMPATSPAEAPARHARWIDEIKALDGGAKALRTYPDLAGVAARLMKTNARLPQGKADWLASHWAEPVPSSAIVSSADRDGADAGTGADPRSLAAAPAPGWRIRGDAAHKVVSPQLYRVEEAQAHFEAITAPTLVIEASDNEMGRWWGGRYGLDEFHQRLAAVKDVRIEKVEQAGHMLHHDQPQQVAALIGQFIR